MGKLRRRTSAMWGCVLASLGASSALAVDLRFTGFATIGYAISDQDFRYLRYIDNDGTFKAD